MPDQSQFKTSYRGLKATPEEQLLDAATALQARLLEFYHQWGFPLKGRGPLISARNFRAPLVKYSDFLDYVQQHGYVELLADFRGRTYLLPGGLNLTKAQKIDILIKAAEIQARIEQAESKHRR